MVGILGVLIEDLSDLQNVFSGIGALVPGTLGNFRNFAFKMGFAQVASANPKQLCYLRCREGPEGLLFLRSKKELRHIVERLR